VAKIGEHGESLAMVLLSGVHYFTGQLFDIETITRAAHELGSCYIGWDLAHAVGNVELRLHEWQVDFAAWCTYKYLNAGAGSIGAIFVHEKHFEAIETHKLKKLDGWWSHRFDTRFQMSNGMITIFVSI
jgi:kynureninase